MRNRLGWSLGAVLAVCAAPASAEADLAGRWAGTYSCTGQPDAAMVLEFSASDRPIHEGVLSFDAGGTTGSHSVTGRASLNGTSHTVKIVPRSWIDQPAGFDTVGLSGRLGADGHSMEGSLTGCRNGRSGSFRIVRPRPEGEAAPAVILTLPQGDATPPEDFGGAIGGALASAASAEAQCRVLAEWYRPVIGPEGFERMASHKILEAIAPLFVDEVFEPVFGLPLALLEQGESRAVSHFIRTCYDSFGMERHRDIFVAVFGSPIYARDIAAIHSRRAEAAAWVVGMRVKLAGIRDRGPEALGALQMLDWEIGQQASRVPAADIGALQAEAAALRTALEAAARTAKADALIAELNAAGNDFARGHLGTALRVADQARASDMAPDQVARVVEAARQKAAAILDPARRSAAAEAAGLPASLAGLIRGRAALNPLESHARSMESTFGSLDPEGQLRPLHARLRTLEGDPAVLAELRAALAEAARGADGQAAVARLAAQVLSPDPARRNHEIAAIIDDASRLAEVAAVRVVDRSTSPDPAEPSAAEIAAFALQRVRAVSEQMAAMDAACTSGRISDPVQAMACLTNPAVWTGQTGSGATLLGVTKLGCQPEVPGTQYLCTFVQEIRIDIAGGEAFGAGRWGT